MGSYWIARCYAGTYVKKNINNRDRKYEEGKEVASTPIANDAKRYCNYNQRSRESPQQDAFLAPLTPTEVLERKIHNALLPRGTDTLRALREHNFFLAHQIICNAK